MAGGTTSGLAVIATVQARPGYEAASAHAQSGRAAIVRQLPGCIGDE
ncbi:antibiotic biosynthesis monooxygenase family protein [Burkholderia dolosa]|nr:hypothetical protein [Burkholderia dolosa]MBR8302089.1 hypothetical protein [Burkholderia dolosa]MBY4753275.1 antibiotic biosynthesis monooxygenase [Burkholderia dolosa]